MNMVIWEKDKRFKIVKACKVDPNNPTVIKQQNALYELMLSQSELSIAIRTEEVKNANRD